VTSRDDSSGAAGGTGAAGTGEGAAEDGVRHVVDQLSAYLDGDMKPHATELVHTHLARCAACTRAADELRAIVAGARSLDRPEPPPTLWPAIEGALAAREGTLLDWRRIFVGGFAVGGLAGATVMILVVLGLHPSGILSSTIKGATTGTTTGATAAMVVGAGPAAGPSMAAADIDPLLQEAETELESAAASYERSIGKLRSLLARMEEPRWSPDARSRFRERLARLDDAIERSRAAARSTPGDSAGNEILFAAYRSKIDFLAEAVHRGGAEEMFHEGGP
jgi:Putative zinc-finger